MTEKQCAHCDKKALKMKKPCKTKNAEKAERFYVCEDCNQKSVRAEAICRPKAISAGFVCKKCGSPGVSKKSLCKPKPV